MSDRENTVLYSRRCEEQLQIAGQSWPSGIALGGALPPNVRIPDSKPDEDLFLTITGRFRSRPGHGHLGAMPAELTDITSITAFEAIKSDYLTVCDLLSRREELNGMRISVRGQFVWTREGAFLKAFDCESEGADGDWRPAIWIEGRTPPPQRRPAGDWRERLRSSDVERTQFVITVTGTFRTSLGTPPQGTGEDNAFLGSLTWENADYFQAIVDGVTVKL